MDCTCQAPLSMEYFRQEYWSGLPCSPSGDLPAPGIEPISPMSPALAGGFFTISTTWEAPYDIWILLNCRFGFILGKAWRFCISNKFPHGADPSDPTNILSKRMPILTKFRKIELLCYFQNPVFINTAMESWNFRLRSIWRFHNSCFILYVWEN